jgi:ligand-binding sensor domain-containing protein
LNSKINGFCCRRVTAAIVVLMLTCAGASRAWSANLWVSYDGGGGVASFAPGQIKQSGSPIPVVLSTYSFSSGLAFDKAGNLWTVSDGEGDQVARFTAAQLKNLKNNPSPTPRVIITGASGFNDLYGCNFDRHGNLWVVNYSGDAIEELSKAQLKAGTANLPSPAKSITSPDLDGPNFVTFDRAGNAWVDNESNDTVVEFSASQLASGGSPPAKVILKDDGSGSSIAAPGEIAFDKDGNLWVPNYGSDTVSEYAKDQLTSSGSPAPKVKLNSAAFNDAGPWGAVFSSKGDLVVMNYSNGTILEFTPQQLKASGAPVPTVSVTGSETTNYQIIFGPSS